MGLMDISDYLGRIGLTERPEPTLAGLRTLHHAHLLSIPYEDLDVQLGKPLTTDPMAAYDKIVNRRRGGWCYEMNGVFGWALGELGFDVTRATGAVMREAMGELSDGNHLVLKVVLKEGVYLADVGFGDGPRDPICVVPGAFEFAWFCVWTEAHRRSLVASCKSSEWQCEELRLQCEPGGRVLLAQKCAMLQTSPQSPFVQNLVVQRHTPYGLAILRGKVLRRLRPGSVVDTTIETADRLVQALREEFELDVPEVASIWPKICARHEEVLAQQRQAAAQS